MTIDPKLSDFTLEQLTRNAKLLIKEQARLKNHIADLRKTPSLARMFRDEIVQFETEIEDLQTLVIHFTFVAEQKRMEQRVASN